MTEDGGHSWGRYHLTKDDFDSIMEFELLGAGAKTAWATVPAAAKSALTRKYNASHQAVSKVKGSGKAGLGRFTEEGEDEPEEEGEEEGEEDFAVKKKPQAAGKGKGKGKAKAR